MGESLTNKEKKLQDYVNKLKEELDTKEDDDIIKYVLETMLALETVLMNAAAIDDPVDFINGLADGSIILVQEGEVKRTDYNNRFKKG